MERLDGMDEVAQAVLEAMAQRIVLTTRCSVDVAQAVALLHGVEKVLNVNVHIAKRVADLVNLKYNSLECLPLGDAPEAVQSFAMPVKSKTRLFLKEGEGADRLTVVTIYAPGRKAQLFVPCVLTKEPQAVQDIYLRFFRKNALLVTPDLQWNPRTKFIFDRCNGGLCTVASLKLRDKTLSVLGRALRKHTQHTRTVVVKSEHGRFPGTNIENVTVVNLVQWFFSRVGPVDVYKLGPNHILALANVFWCHPLELEDGPKGSALVSWMRGQPVGKKDALRLAGLKHAPRVKDTNIFAALAKNAPPERLHAVLRHIMPLNARDILPKTFARRDHLNNVIVPLDGEPVRKAVKRKSRGAPDAKRTKHSCDSD